MAIFGGYGKGGETLPRVLHTSIARYNRELPKSGEALEFLVTIHEEGTGISWQQNVTVDAETQRYFVEATDNLHLWSLDLALTAERAREVAEEMGARLYQTFFGAEGTKYLANIPPTALLLNADETILNLPWELLRDAKGNLIAREIPFGRLVTTRFMPRAGRDPLQEDNVVRILAVVNPSADLAGSVPEIRALKELARKYGRFSVEVDVLEQKEATLKRFAEMLAEGDYDILHFAGHGAFDRSAPELSALQFADGTLPASDVLDLKWKAPPYFVFNSACESARAAAGRQLVTGQNHGNGLAAAFLAAGVAAYAGYFWPVADVGAAEFAFEFYHALLQRENVGLAFLEARRATTSPYRDTYDLTGYSAILYGDAANKHRRDLATAS